MRRLLALLLGAGLLGLALAGAWVATTLQPAADTPGETRVFVVERGQGLGQVARRLEREGLVRDARVFSLLARLRGLEAGIQAGEYEVDPAQAPQAILATLTSGRVRRYRVVVPEGLRATEIAARFEQAGLADAGAFLEAVADPALAASLGVPAEDLEGYLFPETYELPRNLPPREIVRVMVEQFQLVWAGIEPLAGDMEVPLEPHQIVTLASIVEKETGAPQERPVIASVFLNRLRKGMRLETDPTVIYGIEDFDGNLTRRHLQDGSNPYNTYRIKGLPPGPIASPGAAALRAVVEPAETDYLFFVSRNDGTHVFSRTYREHVNNVNHFQRNRANRKRYREARNRHE